MRGTEWIVDARGCDPSALRDAGRLQAVFDRLVADLRLTPIAAAAWHTFPPPGGITGFLLLAESHLACHTFPEFGSVCLDIFCCRAPYDADIARAVSEVLGATDVQVRLVEREYGPSIVRNPSAVLAP
jgi:S-adenosylmethionine decarboxylase